MLARDAGCSRPRVCISIGVPGGGEGSGLLASVTRYDSWLTTNRALKLISRQSTPGELPGIDPIVATLIRVGRTANGGRCLYGRCLQSKRGLSGHASSVGSVDHERSAGRRRPGSGGTFFMWLHAYPDRGSRQACQGRRLPGRGHVLRSGHRRPRDRAADWITS
jgi:hypothetical protein